MRRLTLFLLLVFAFDLDQASAQLFGSRQLGQPLSRRSAPSGMAGGMLSGGERFLRGNRDRADFVGTDIGEVRGFVGRQESSLATTVIPATMTLQQRVDRASQINRVLRARARNTMYEPTLTLGFALDPTTVSRLRSRAEAQLTQSMHSRFGDQIAVSLEAQTAILRGEVASAEDRYLAETMVWLEPGIAGVRNLIEVVSNQSDQPLNR